MREGKDNDGLTAETSLEGRDGKERADATAGAVPPSGRGGGGVAVEEGGPSTGGGEAYDNNRLPLDFSAGDRRLWWWVGGSSG